MRPLPVFLACLVVVALFDFGLDVRQRASSLALTPLLAQIEPSTQADAAFDARLAASADPAELRAMARTQYAKRLDAHRLTLALTRSYTQMHAAALLRSGTLLVLSLCALAAALRPRRVAVGKA